MKHYLLSIISLFVITDSFAQTSVWKAEKSGNIIYFASDFGAIARSDYPLPQEYYKASNASDILVLIKEYKEYDDYTVVDTSVLKASTDAQSYKTLMNLGKKLKVKMDYLKCQTSTDALNYLYAAQYLKMGINGRSIGISFLRSAERAEKEIQYLTNKEALDSISEKETQEMLDKRFKKNLEDFDDLKKDYKAYRKNWMNGETEEITNHIEKLKKENPMSYELNYLAKIKLYLPKIEELLTNDKIEFVLMSRFHMLGEEGIFALLKKKGFTFEQKKD